MPALPSNQPGGSDNPAFDQPTLPLLPAMPVATDDNVVQAINAIRNVVQQLGSPNTLPRENNNAGTRSQQPVNSRGNTKQNDQRAKPKKSRWIEKSRQKAVVRVYNPDDHDQYVDVEQINQLVMEDQVTGATWVWSR